MNPALVAHVEEYVGRVDAGWSRDVAGRQMPFQVVRLLNPSIPERVAYSTLGLSDIALASRRSDKRILHELIIVTYLAATDQAIPGLLQQIGVEALQSGYAYLRGDVIGPRGPLWPESGSALEALYVTVPTCFADEFATCETPRGTVVFGWLLPIHPKEAAYVRDKGWDAFEDRLVEHDPDVFDLHRPQLALSAAQR
jgi:hypothetical protein